MKLKGRRFANGVAALRPWIPRYWTLAARRRANKAALSI